MIDDASTTIQQLFGMPKRHFHGKMMAFSRWSSGGDEFSHQWSPFTNSQGPDV